MSETYPEMKEEPYWEADASVEWDPLLGEPQPPENGQISYEMECKAENLEDYPNDNSAAEPSAAEDVTDPLDFKTQISESKCVLCDLYLDSNVTTVRSRGLRSFIAASQQRRDGKEIYFEGRTSLRVHSKCRSKYTNYKSINACSKRSMKDAKPRFNFKSYCVICARAADEGFVRAQFALPAARRRAAARVLEPELQAARVLEPELQAARVLEPELQAARVLEPELQAARVLEPELQAARVLEPELQAARVLEPELQAARVLEPELQAARVLEPELQAARVLEPELQAARVLEPELQAARVLEPELQAARVLAPELQAALLRAAAAHADDWSRHVVQRIDKVDLCKERAAYHPDCLAKFTSPRRDRAPAAGPAPDDDIRRHTMSTVMVTEQNGGEPGSAPSYDSSAKCLICHLPVTSDATAVGEQRPSLIEASRRRGDGKEMLFEMEEEFVLHGKCQMAYVDAEAIRECRARFDSEPDIFDFETCCLMCGGDASKEFVKKQAKMPANKRIGVSRVTRPDSRAAIVRAAAMHNDEWSHEVLRRIHNVDLQERNAVYHKQCYSKFAHNHRARPSLRRGRQLLPETSEALEHVYNYVDSYTDDCQLTADEIREALPNVAVPKNYSLIYNLKKKYGDDIVATRQPAVLSLITRCPIRDSWYAEREKNETAEKLRIIDMAASIIIEDIQSRICDNETYPSAASFLDGAEDHCPATLLRLLRTIIVGNKTDREPFERKSVALTHAVVSAARPKSFKSPVLLGLSAMIHQKYASRHLIEVLHGFGFGATYDETLRFQACASTAYESSIPKNPQEFAQFVFETTGETLIGVQCTNPASNVLNEKIPRLRRIPTSFPKRIEQIPTLTYSEPENSGLENIAFAPPTENEGLQITPPDLLCMLAKSRKLPNVPGCNYFMCLKNTEKSTDVLISEVKPTPFISSGSSFDKVLTALDFAVTQCKRYKLDCCVVTFEEPLYQRAQTIVKSSTNPDFSRIVLRLEASGLLKSFLEAVGKIMNGSGLEELWASIYTKDSIDDMMSGQHWERSVRAHWLTSVALFYIISKFLTLDLKEGMELDRSLFVLVDGKLLDVDSNIAEAVIKKINDSLKGFEQRGPTAALWASYFKMTMIIQSFIRAERTGDWFLHISCVRRMLPYLHAAGHFEYAKAAAMYLQDMNNLEETMSPESYQKFVAKKLFTVRMTKEAGGDIFYDRVMQRSSLNKNESGLDSLKNWALGLPVMHCISEIIENFSSHADTVAGLKDGTKARILKDDNDLEHFMKWFEEHDPFPNVLDIMCISNRLKGGIDTNPHDALKIGQDIMNKRIGVSFAKLKYSRTETIQPFATLNSAIALHKVNVPVDPYTILGRVSRLKTSPEEMRRYLQYELAPYPLSLFDKSGMRRTNKSKFYQMYEATDYEETGGAHIVDGTLLLRVAESPLTITTCVQRVKQYANPTVVFEGYSSENCVKTQETLRTEASLDSAAFDENAVITDPKKFLSCYKNRARFIGMLIQHLNAENIQTVQCSGVADTTIVSIAVAMASERVYPAVTVVSNDVDVLAMLTAKNCEDVSVLRPGFKGAPGRLYNAAKFNGYPSIALIAHAFTGSDVTSAIYKRGKTLACSKLTDNDDLRRKLSVFKDPLAKTEDIIKAGEEFFCHLYGDKTNLNELRYEEFARSFTKSKRDLAALPPTVAAAKQHSLRVYYQVQKWLDNELDPAEWGWERRATGLYPIATLDDLVPREVLKVVACKCKGSCVGCACVEAGLECCCLCSREAIERRGREATEAAELDEEVELHMDRSEMDECDDIVDKRSKQANKRKFTSAF